MNKPTFTKGPWKVYGRGLDMDELAGHQHGCIFADNGDNDGDGRNICDIAESERIVHKDKRRHDGFAHSQEDEANARLIAAAPELFAQCKFLEKVLTEAIMSGDSGADLELDQLRELLAKVEGEK